MRRRVSKAAGLLSGALALPALAASPVDHTARLRFPDFQSIEIELDATDEEAVATCRIQVSAAIMVSPSGQPADPSAYEIGSVTLSSESHFVLFGEPVRFELGAPELASFAARSGALGYFHYARPVVQTACSFERSFRSWCRDPGLTSGQRLTVASLKIAAQTDDCEAGELALYRLRDLSLMEPFNARYEQCDFMPLRSLPWLTGLTLSGSSNVSVDPAVTATTRIRDALAGLQRLERLVLLHTPAIEPSRLPPLPRLRQLEMAGPSLSQAGLDALTAFPRLESLSLDYEERFDVLAMRTPLSLESIGHLSRLELLELSGFQAASAAPLARLTSLKHLALDYTGLTDVSPLVALRLLRSLSLQFNRIAQPGVLGSLTELEALDLSQNTAVSLAGLDRLDKLTSLRAAGNRIVDAAAVVAMPSLRELVLQRNALVSLAFLATLPETTDVHAVSGNPVARTPVACPTSTGPLSLRAECAAYLAEEEPRRDPPIVVDPRPWWPRLDICRIQPQLCVRLVPPVRRPPLPRPPIELEVRPTEPP
jgi:hypothetical protein